MRFCLVLLLGIPSLAFANSRNNDLNRNDNAAAAANNNADELFSVFQSFAKDLSHHDNFRQRSLKEEQHDDSSKSHRKLTAPYPCNEVIATIRPSEVRNIVNTFLTNISPDNAFFLGLVLGNFLQYGVQIKKVCINCASVRADLNQNFEFSPESMATYERYCGEQIYGYDSNHSGLVMIPMVETGSGDLVPPSGTLPGFVFARSTKVNRFDVPSQMWSSSNNHSDPEMLMCLLATAIKGTVTFAPDFMGYGNSEAFKSYLIRDSYVTSFLPMWIQISNELREGSNCMTALGDAAFVNGYSEGGFAAIAIAEGLNKALNIDIVQVRAGGSPSDIVTTMMSIIESIDVGLIDAYLSYVPLIGSSFSSTNPSVANYNTGQNLLNSKYMDPSVPELNALAWVEEVNINGYLLLERILGMASSLNMTSGEFINLEFFNSNITSLFRDAIIADVANPCSPTFSGYQIGVNDKLCEVWVQNSLTDVLYNVNYPVNLCHSINDELVSYTNVPDITQNPDYLEVNPQVEDHFGTGVLCYGFDMQFLMSSAFTNYVPPNKHSLNGCRCKGSKNWL